ncbi:MAG: NADPH-dependent glutamate synthase [Candidatus Omnitrophica bacterium]|nr:NADPH-dependent glutamate synthase [Candidatus Omnitrophota bacterium]MDD5610132.1 NADPH-dependent glutamate synthase [Candidatus Omnitrophota bacterium]
MKNSDNAKMRQQLPEERVKNFFEVALGLNEEEALKEAKRCLACKNPQCVLGCPVGVDIPAFIKLLAEGKRKEALEKIKEKNNLPAVCGRVCPQEDQCEALCVLAKKKFAINIGALERYAADLEMGQTFKPKAGPKTGIKVAIAGSGPAGLTTAADLAKMGYSVTLFESLNLPGGVLSYGIPEFRLPKKIVEREVDYIRSLGVEIKTDYLIGRTLTVKDLFGQGFKAIFLGLGAGLPQFLGIEGENLDRVYSANEFLTRLNLMKAYKFPEYATPLNIEGKVAVIGAGNVAFDCARWAMRLGKEVTLVYRRSESEMPARKDEIENAREEGLKFSLLTQPVKFISDEKGYVRAIECLKMKLGEPDASGRRRPVPVENSNFIIEANTVVVAIGQSPNPLLSKATPELKINPDGTIAVDEKLMTSIPGVFAGGDIITGADTVIKAMGAGKKAAKEIDQWLKKSR